MNISLLGYGLTTRAIARKLGGGQTFYDDRTTEAWTDEEGNRILPSADFKPEKSDLEILTPSIPPHHPLLEKARNPISEYDFFLSPSSTRYPLPATHSQSKPFTVWISGTNGKTTTTQMLTHLLKGKGALSGGNMFKGLTIGGFGLGLAMIGLDPIQGIPRYTLEPLLGQKESLFLWDGINFVAITVGLFAIPEIIDLGVKGTGIAERASDKLGGVTEGVKDTFRHWALVLRCSALGAYIGILPGLGGGPAQWMAYAHAVQSTEDKSRFGKGAVEGVLGPGAANNSKEGGSLIPTIAFGIPGSLSMAVLLGAFIIQGLVPGPNMLDPNLPVRPDAAALGEFVPTGLELTFSFVWVLIISNIITVAVAFLFLGQLARITEIRGALIIPFILLLVYLGGFTVANRPQDLALVIVFGVLGWLMVKYDWPRPPMLLGLVLGRLAENRLFISTQIHGDFGWIDRPGVIIIGVIILVSLFYPSWQERRQRRRLGNADSHQPAPGAPIDGDF